MENENGSRRMSRRQFLVLGGTGLVTLVAASCGGAATTTPAPAKDAAKAPASGAAAPAPAKVQGTVEFMAWGDQADVPAWDKLAQMFGEKNPNVKVNVTSVADPGNNMYPKFQTAIAGGTPPNLAGFQGWEWQVYSDKNILAPLDDYISRDKFTWAYPAEFTTVEQSCRRKGKTYLVPMQVATMVMFYAKKVFDEAGVKYPTDDWTFDEFMEMTKKLTNTGAANKRFGFQPNGQWFRDIGFIVLTGKREFDTIIDPKKAQFNQPEIVKMVQTMAVDVVYNLKVSPSASDTQGGANSINTGNCALKYEGPWFFPQLNSPQLREQKKEVPFDVVMMPKGADSKRTHRGWSEGVVLPKSNNQDAAWAFASYMAGEEGNKTYSEISGRIPNNPKLVESFWLPTIKDRFGVSNGKAFLEALKNTQIDVVSGVPRSKMWSEVVKPVGWDPLVAGSKKAEEVLPEVDKKLNALLDDYWKSNP